MNTVVTPAVLSLIGRSLIALLFLMAGASKLANLAGTAGYIASGGLPAPMLLATAVGAFEVLAGLMLLLGWQARAAAIALAVFTVAASVLFHAFWSVPAEQQMVQQLMFMKNIAVTGGLLVVAALGAGPWSLDERRAPGRLARA
jgi:putative oxidoreductase